MIGLARQVREVFEVPRDLLLGRYPAFVTGGDLAPGEVPVFVFHSLEPERFARQLGFLAENAYRTLSADEYLDVLTGGSRAPERAVLLTFDDGRGSLWTVGRPLLRRHGMRGVVFLVPGRTRSRPGPPWPDWDDVEAGRAPLAAVRDRERAEGALLSWEEVRALARSGELEFQSHTLTHARVHTGPHVVGFMTPWMRDGYSAMDVPLVAAEGRDLLADEVPLGTPLLRSAPLTSEEPRFREDPAVRAACVAAVAAAGGEEFFRQPGWERTLRRLVPSRVPGSLEAVASREGALRREMREARRLIEEQTGRPALHLCYPWHAAGPTARRMAVEAGYRSGFCGKVAGTPLTPPGGDVRAIARVGEDYVELLPGRGRARLAHVLSRKWRRRLRRRA